eukprot:SAG31_NODE_4531_length_3158_cov_4.651193_4_plen_79_part_00
MPTSVCAPHGAKEHDGIKWKRAALPKCKFSLPLELVCIVPGATWQDDIIVKMDFGWCKNDAHCIRFAGDKELLQSGRR